MSVTVPSPAPWSKLIQTENLPAQVTVLRPPTFDNLRRHLQKNPSHYHVLHFDSHGGIGAGGGEFSPNRYRAPQGCLVFEDPDGKPDEKSAADLSTLLRDHALPAVVLNACRSATFDPNAPNPFTTGRRTAAKPNAQCRRHGLFAQRQRSPRSSSPPSIAASLNKAA